MNTATLPAVRVEPALRRDAEAVLDDGESPSDFEDLAIERELASATPELDVVRRHTDAVDRAFRLLEFSPCSCRKAARPQNDNQS